MGVLSNILTPARIAVITTWMAGLAAFLIGVVGTLPAGWQNTALIIAGLLTKVVSVVKFLDGNSKWERLITAHTLTGIADPAVPPVEPPKA